MGILHLTPAELAETESVKYVIYDLIILQGEPQLNELTCYYSAVIAAVS